MKAYDFSDGELTAATPGGIDINLLVRQFLDILQAQKLLNERVDYLKERVLSLEMQIRSSR